MNGRAQTGVGRLLTLRPMRWIGDISYSLYLWHWPLLVVGTYLLGGELRARYGLLIVAFAVLPAWLSYRFIENPFRDWGWVKQSVRRSLLAGAGLMAATAVCADVVYAVPGFTNPEYQAGAATKIGAEAPADDYANDDLPTFTDAASPSTSSRAGSRRRPPRRATTTPSSTNSAAITPAATTRPGSRDASSATRRAT